MDWQDFSTPSARRHQSPSASVQRLPSGHTAVDGVPLCTSAMNNAYRGRDLALPAPVSRAGIREPRATPVSPSAQDIDRSRAPFTAGYRLRLQSSLDILTVTDSNEILQSHTESQHQPPLDSARTPQQQNEHIQETAGREAILSSAQQRQNIRHAAQALATDRQRQVANDRQSDHSSSGTSETQEIVGPRPPLDEEPDDHDHEFNSYITRTSDTTYPHERDNDAVICVDSGSGVHLDRKLRPDTVDSAVPNYDKRLTIKGIDGRSLKVTHHGYIPGRGLFVVCPQAAADLLSVTELDREGHEVKFKNGTVHITDSKGTQIMGYRAKDHLLYVMRTDIQTLGTTRPKRAICGRPNKHWNRGQRDYYFTSATLHSSGTRACP
jgi:hypothetical protein